MTAPNSFRHGSFSTLSPHAPPFMVDRSSSNSKINPTVSMPHASSEVAGYLGRTYSSNSFKNMGCLVSESDEGHWNEYDYSCTESEGVVPSVIPACSLIEAEQSPSLYPSSCEYVQNQSACGYLPMSSVSRTEVYQNGVKKSGNFLTWQAPQSVSYLASCPTAMPGGCFSKTSRGLEDSSAVCLDTHKSGKEFRAVLKEADTTNVKTSLAQELKLILAGPSPATNMQSSLLASKEKQYYPWPELWSASTQTFLDWSEAVPDGSNVPAESVSKHPWVMKSNNISSVNDSAALMNLHAQKSELIASEGHSNRHQVESQLNYFSHSTSSNMAKFDVPAKEVVSKQTLSNNPAISASEYTELADQNLKQINTLACAEECSSGSPRAFFEELETNEAVDSPCWRGASASHVPANVSLPLHAKEYTEALDKNLICPKAYDSLISLMNSSTCFSVHDQKMSFPENIASNELSNAGNKTTQIHDGVQEPVEHVSKMDAEPGDKSFGGSNVKSLKGGAVSGSAHLVGQHISNDLSSKVSGSSRMPAGALDAARRVSSSKLDKDMLVKVAHNLSELLLSGYTDDGDALEESNSETLRSAIRNLVNCALLDEKARSSPAPNASHSFSESSLDHPKASSVERIQDDDKPGLSRYQKSSLYFTEQNRGFHNDQCIERGHMKVGASTDTFLNQTVKRVLDECFHDSNDKHPRVLLYKKLWLEAEASLCCLKYEHQLDTLKASEGESSPNDISSDDCFAVLNPRTAYGNSDYSVSVPKILEMPLSGGYVAANGFSQSGSNEIEDASVMARLQILQSRTGNSNFSFGSAFYNAPVLVDYKDKDAMSNTIQTVLHIKDAKNRM